MPLKAHRPLPLNWTGCTWFTIKESFQNTHGSTKIITNPKGQAKGFEMALVLSVVSEVEQCLQKEIPDDQIAFLASAAKRQKVEVREKDLTPGELELFLQAKNKEVNSWLSTETVRRISRNMIPEDQILRSRWVVGHGSQLILQNCLNLRQPSRWNRKPVWWFWVLKTLNWIHWLEIAQQWVVIVVLCYCNTLLPQNGWSNHLTFRQPSLEVAEPMVVS